MTGFELEDLTTSPARKIWQKIMIVRKGELASDPSSQSAPTIDVGGTL